MKCAGNQTAERRPQPPADVPAGLTALHHVLRQALE